MTKLVHLPDCDLVRTRTVHMQTQIEIPSHHGVATMPYFLRGYTRSCMLESPWSQWQTTNIAYRYKTKPGLL